MAALPAYTQNDTRLRDYQTNQPSVDKRFGDYQKLIVDKTTVDGDNMSEERLHLDQNINTVSAEEKDDFDLILDRHQDTAGSHDREQLLNIYRDDPRFKAHVYRRFLSDVEEDTDADVETISSDEGKPLHRQTGQNIQPGQRLDEGGLLYRQTGQNTKLGQRLDEGGLLYRQTGQNTQLGQRLDEGGLLHRQTGQNTQLGQRLDEGELWHRHIGQLGGRLDEDQLSFRQTGQHTQLGERLNEGQPFRQTGQHTQLDEDRLSFRQAGQYIQLGQRLNEGELSLRQTGQHTQLGERLDEDETLYRQTGQHTQPDERLDEGELSLRQMGQHSQLGERLDDGELSLRQTGQHSLLGGRLDEDQLSLRQTGQHIQLGERLDEDRLSFRQAGQYIQLGQRLNEGQLSLGQTEQHSQLGERLDKDEPLYRQTGQHTQPGQRQDEGEHSLRQIGQHIQPGQWLDQSGNLGQWPDQSRNERSDIDDVFGLHPTDVTDRPSDESTYRYQLPLHQRNDGYNDAIAQDVPTHIEGPVTPEVKTNVNNPYLDGQLQSSYFTEKQNTNSEASKGVGHQTNSVNKYFEKKVVDLGQSHLPISDETGHEYVTHQSPQFPHKTNNFDPEYQSTGSDLQTQQTNDVPRNQEGVTPDISSPHFQYQPPGGVEPNYAHHLRRSSSSGFIDWEAPDIEVESLPLVEEYRQESLELRELNFQVNNYLCIIRVSSFCLSFVNYPHHLQ